MRTVTSPLPQHLIFPLTVCGQCPELARGRRWSRNLEPDFCPGRDLNPEPHGWWSSTLTIQWDYSEALPIPEQPDNGTSARLVFTRWHTTYQIIITVVV